MLHCPSSPPSPSLLPSHSQVQQETVNVDLMGFELEKGDKGKMTERVIAVGEQARTPYGGQNLLVLTTYR